MAENTQSDLDALTRAINNISRDFTIATQEIAHFVNAPTAARGNQILNLLAAVQAQILGLATIVNTNDIIAQNTHNAVMRTMNGHIATLLTATSAITGLISVAQESTMRVINAVAGIIGPWQGHHGFLPPRLDGLTPQSHESRARCSQNISRCRDEFKFPSGRVG